MQRRTVRGFLSQVFLVGRTHPSDPFSSTTLGPHSGRRAVQTLAPPHRTSGLTAPLLLPALISYPRRQSEGPSPAAEPAASPHGKEGEGWKGMELG